MPPPNPSQQPNPQPQSLADIKAEREYQRLLAKRVDAARQQAKATDARLAALRQESRLQADIARLTNQPATAAQRHAAGVQGRLAEMREQRQLLREQAAIARDVRAADLRQRYGGRLGGALAGAERFGQSGMGRTLLGGAAAAGATLGGMARSGFSGTVEQNRFDFEMKLLSREAAAAFKPMLELGTSLVTRARRLLEGLGPGGQDAMMYGGAALGAYGTYRFAGAAGRMLGFGGGAMAGAAGAAGGGAMGPAAMAALAGASGGGAAAGGRSLAGRVARFPIKHPFMTAALVLGGASAASSGSPSNGNEYRAARGADADELDRLESTGGTAAMLQQYNEIRGRRTAGAKTYSAIGGMFGGAGPEHDRLVELERRLMAQGITPSTGKRQVTPDQFGYEEVGSAYRRASVGFLSATAASQQKKAEEQAAAGGGGIDSTAPAAMIERGFANLLEFLHGAVGQLTKPPVN